MKIGVAALCLACILFEGCPSKQRKAPSPDKSAAVLEALQSLVSWIASRLQSSTSTCLALVTPALSVLIAAPEARSLFDQAGGIGFLVRHLRVRQVGPKKNSSSVQHLYELCFCLWIMTYECKTSEEMRSHFHRDQAVFALVVRQTQPDPPF
jgi:V-ATPase subunit H